MLREKSDHVCLRCGLCCQGRGNLTGGYYSEYVSEVDDCPALAFVGEVAVCQMQDCKRDCCKDYPFLTPDSTDPQDFMCERELKQAGLWKEYTGLLA